MLFSKKKQISTRKKTVKRYGEFSIYALIDPDTHRIFYVGRSKNADTRVGQHINEAKNSNEVGFFNHLWGIISGDEVKYKKSSNPRKTNWINDIKNRGKEPIVKILDMWECDTIQDANRLEEAWIAEMRRLGEPLTNVILSHRMNPSWYRKPNKSNTNGWARSPMEYISLLKQNKLAKPNNNTTVYTSTNEDENNDSKTHIKVKPKKAKWDNKNISSTFTNSKNYRKSRMKKLLDKYKTKDV